MLTPQKKYSFNKDNFSSNLQITKNYKEKSS
jgi:hypothetical protein